MEGDNSSGSLLHKLLASPRFVKRESQKQAEEIAVLKSFRTLSEEESYPHPTNDGNLNNRFEIKNDIRSERRVEQLDTEDSKDGILQSSPFPSWKRSFSSSCTVLADSDVVKVTRVETYSDNENEEEDGGGLLPGEWKVIEKSLDLNKENVKQTWDLDHHERKSNVPKTDLTLHLLSDKSVSELTREDRISVTNRTWSTENSDRQQDPSLYSVHNVEQEITSKGTLKGSYLVHYSGGETNVDTGLDVPAAQDPILREHTDSVVPGNSSGDGQKALSYMTEDSLHVSPYKTEDSLHVSSYETEDYIHVPPTCGSNLNLFTDCQPTPDGNALDSSLQISHQEESWKTPTQKSLTVVMSPSSAVQPESSMTKDPLWVDQKESLNDSVPSVISSSQDIKEDMPATKETTSNSSLTPSPKSLPSTPREPFQLPALFSGLRVVKKGTAGEDRETLSEIKQKDADRALMSLKQHVNKAKFKQNQASTSTHKKGADPKEGTESKNKWRQMLNFDDIHSEEHLEKKPKDTEGLSTGEKELAKDTTCDSFKFLSSFKTLMKDSGDVSVDLEAVKKKRKNDRELLKSIFEKPLSKSASTDKSPEELKVCITQNVLSV